MSYRIWILTIACTAAGCRAKEIGPLEREVRLEGLPTCAPETAYARQVVAQLKPKAGSAETQFSSGLTFMTPLLPGSGLRAPTTAFTNTLRVGLCDPTRIPNGISTECSTPITPVLERTLTVPAGRDPIVITVGPIVACGPPGSANSNYWAR